MRMKKTRFRAYQLEDSIVTLAQVEKADIIIMATHGRQGLNRLLFGSVAEKVVKTSPVPVMTIRPEA